MKNALLVAVSLSAFLALAGLAAFSASADELIIYPAKGQSEAKMGKDKSDCKSWATKETGIDPLALAQETQPAAKSGPTGKRLGGAGRGAAGGAVAGAIAGDAGKGAAMGAALGTMKGGVEVRKERREERAEEKQAESSHQQKLATYNKAYCACLEGRGYTVK